MGDTIAKLPARMASTRRLCDLTRPQLPAASCGSKVVREIHQDTITARRRFDPAHERSRAFALLNKKSDRGFPHDDATHRTQRSERRILRYIIDWNQTNRNPARKLARRNAHAQSHTGLVGVECLVRPYERDFIDIDDECHEAGTVEGGFFRRCRP